MSTNKISKLAIPIAATVVIGVAVIFILRPNPIATDAQQLKQIGTSLASYSADNDGLIPPYAFENYGKMRADQSAFISALLPYHKQPRLFLSPGHEELTRGKQGEFGDFDHTSYVITTDVYFRASTTPIGAMIFNLKEAKNPEKLMLFMNNTIITKGPDGKEVRSTIFGKEINCLYADLSVKTEPVIQP